MASQAALRTILLTPLPKYLAAPCCSISTHCLDWQEVGAAEQLCTAVADLWDMTDRWMAKAGFSNKILVLCPHLELVRVVPKNRNWLSHLRKAFRSDGVRLTRSAYDDLAEQVWRLVGKQQDGGGRGQLTSSTDISASHTGPHVPWSSSRVWLGGQEQGGVQQPSLPLLSQQQFLSPPPPVAGSPLLFVGAWPDPLGAWRQIPPPLIDRRLVQDSHHHHHRGHHN